MYGVTSQCDVRADVIEARAEIGKCGRSIRQRDLPEQPRLFDRSANVDVGDDRPARIDETRHEGAEESHVDAVGADMTTNRISREAHVLDDELRLAAVLQNQRVQGHKSLGELSSARRFEAIAIVGIDQHVGGVEPYYGSVPAAREIASEVGLDTALAHHRRAEMPGSRGGQRHRPLPRLAWAKGSSLRH